MRFQFPYIPPLHTSPTTVESSFSSVNYVFALLQAIFCLQMAFQEAKIENPPTTMTLSLALLPPLFLFLTR